MPSINVPFETAEELSNLRAWKRRYAESIGKDAEEVSWANLLNAYANARVLP